MVGQAYIEWDGGCMRVRDPLAEVSAILPVAIADCLMRLSKEKQSVVEEIRLRRGHPASIVLPAREESLMVEPVTERDLREVLERATNSSAHTVLGQMKNGFVTLKGGHRIGLCGTVSCKEDGGVLLRHISSLAIRVARAVEGRADELMSKLVENENFMSTLILGAPGSGKTTLLRDVVRAISDGAGICPMRVGVADERGEIAAMWKGEPQFYLGERTDVLDGCSKAMALSVLLRTMNPQVVVADEITHPDDVRAISEAAGCGTALLVTAHAGSLADLYRRPVYRAMLELGVFRRAVVLSRCDGIRKAEVEVLV